MILSLPNLTHLHLLLNHFPTIGFGIGLGLFLLGLVGGSDDVKRASLGVLFGVALLTLPTYVTGAAAQEAIKGRPDVSEAATAAHQNAALLGFVFMDLVGAAAWFGLWQFRRISRLTRGNVATVLLLSVVTLGLMTRAANLGGDIHHPEIRAGQDAAASEAAAGAGAGGLDTAAIKLFVETHAWVWPASETLHFVGLCLLCGVVLLVNLRMLGMMTNTAFTVFHRLLPWGMLGFVINSVTGMVFFVATPSQYDHSMPFYWKMAFILLAGANLLYQTLFDEAWAVKQGDEAPFTAKLVAASAIFLWAGIIYWGRMLPYLGDAF